jgi:hypothetical protein
MRKFLRLLPALIFLIAAPPTLAEDSGWRVEERCVGKPIQPAPDWTFDGTILLTGNSGIHGVNAAWETPHVLTFLDYYDLWGGALSPDGTLYASPRGDFTITETYNGITEIDELRIYSVDGQRKYVSLPVDRNQYFFSQYTHAQVYWRDNENFVYDHRQFNVLTGEGEEWPTPDYAYDGYPERRFRIAPDWIRWIFWGMNSQRDWVWSLADLTRSQFFLETPYIGPTAHAGEKSIDNRIIGELNITTPIAWTHDSTVFVATITDNADIPTYSLVLYDREGNRIEPIFHVPDEQQLGWLTVGWSQDSRYFAFVAFDMYISDGKAYPGIYHNPHNTLYIADTQDKVIYNTCMAIGDGVAWSSTTDELALIAPGEGLKAVYILDMNDYGLHRVAWHTVDYNVRIYQGGMDAKYGIIGWREN